MKRILTLAAVCLFVFQLNAQTLPQGIAYQAVAVKEGPYSLAGQNAPTIYWSNKDIQVRFTILDKYPSGTSQYSEVHATTTDGFGVFNLIIGQGDVLSGDFTKIPWELGTAHLQVEIDFDNDGSFKLTSLEKFWSVPYAFITRKSGSASTDSSLNALNNKFNYLRNRDKDTVIGNEGGVSYASLDSLNQVLLAKLAKLESMNALDKDTVIGNELQNLSLKGDSLTISDGNTVKIDFPINLDNDPVNEIQSLTIKGDSLSISDGNTVKIDFPINLDNDATNEIQSLTIKGDSLTISDGNTVKIDFPINLDNDTTNEIQTISLVNDTISLSNGGGNVSLESIKTYVNSSSGTSGKNGTVDDMWFGVRPNLSAQQPLLYLDADTVYVLDITNRLTPYVIKLYPDGSRDTLIKLADNASSARNMRVSLPYLYHTVYGSPTKTKIYHIDTGFVRVAKTSFILSNIATDNITTDEHHNLIYLEKGFNSFRAGTVYFYNFKKDTTYTLTNPNYDYQGLTPPQLINDSMVLIAPRIWKTSSDTLKPTSQVIDFYYYSSISQLFKPIVINDHKVLYEKQVYERYGTSAGWYTVLKLYDLKTQSSIVVDGKKGRARDTRNGGTYRMYNFKGISDKKLLISMDYNNTLYWFDNDKNYLKRFIPQFPEDQITLNTENRCYYKRISLISGTYKVNNFTRLSFPNVNYSRPTSGITYLHE